MRKWFLLLVALMAISRAARAQADDDSDDWDLDDYLSRLNSTDAATLVTKIRAGKLAEILMQIKEKTGPAFNVLAELPTPVQTCLAVLSTGLPQAEIDVCLKDPCGALSTCETFAGSLQNILSKNPECTNLITHPSDHYEEYYDRFCFTSPETLAKYCANQSPTTSPASASPVPTPTVSPSGPKPPAPSSSHALSGLAAVLAGVVAFI